MVLLVCAITTVAIAGQSDAHESGVCGENAYWTLDDDGGLIISGTGSIDSSFMNRASIVYVEIEEGVTEIGWDVFIGCTSLVSVEIPDTVTSIGFEAFRGCTSLTSVEIPDSVTSLGNCLFSGCTSLTSVRLPDSMTTIGSSMFEGCSSLTSITIPDTVTFIDSGAFWRCTALASVEIPPAVTTIESGAFVDCTSLTSVEIPASVTYISDDPVFGGCTSLVSVKVHGQLPYIHSFMFDGCTSLSSIDVDESNSNYCSIDGVVYDKEVKEIVIYPPARPGDPYIIPDSVTTFYDLFSNCTALVSVRIPESVTSIDGGAFSGCTSLESVDIPGSVTYIGSGAFWACDSLMNVDVDEANSTYCSVGGIVFDKGMEELILYPAGRTGASYEIPDTVTTIGDYAFGDCASLESVRIPESVTYIGISAFKGCSSLNRIEVDEGNSVYGSVDGVLLSKDMKTLRQYPTGRSDDPYTVPDCVTTIGSGAFQDCASLESVKIPKSVTKIGSSAFENCTSLAYVIMSCPVKTIEMLCSAVVSRCPESSFRIQSPLSVMMPSKDADRCPASTSPVR